MTQHNQQSDPFGEKLHVLREALKQAGVKLTHQRIEIFREAVNSGDHPDAESILRGVRRRMPTVSLDTVYRTLWLFVDLGLMGTLGPPRDRVRFDPNVRPHHHFVCTRCGRTHDFYCERFDHLNLPAEVAQFGKIDTTQVEVKGLCRECSKSPEPGNAG